MTQEKTQETPPTEPIVDPKINPVEEEALDYRDKYLRLLAEMDNTRKRMQREKQEMTRFAVENVIADLLGPIDNLENALKFASQMSEEVRQWASGFQMITEQFKDVLANHGVTPFSSVGQMFDPHLHHAIETEETDEKPEGMIVQEFVKGYASKDHTVRPSSVKVARPKIKEQNNQEQ